MSNSPTHHSDVPLAPKENSFAPKKNSQVPAATDSTRAASTALPAPSFVTSTAGLFILALFCCFLWGSAFPSIKVGNVLFGINSQDAASQFVFAGARFTLAGLMVIIFMSILRKKPLIPAKRDIGPILLQSLFQTVLQYAFFYPGVSRGTGVVSAIINSSSTFLAILVSALIFKQEKLTPPKIAGAVLGFSGVILITTGGSLAALTGAASSNIINPGQFLVLGSALAGAFSTCIIKRSSQTHNPVLISGWQFFIGGIFLLLLGTVLGGKLHPQTPAAFGLLTYMGFISAAAYSTWSILLKNNPVSRVTIFGFMNPVFGSLLSALILGEGALLNPIITVAALALVSAGIIVVNRARRNPPAKEA